MKPSFEKVTGQKLDEALRKFFLEGLGYERIDNDPGEKPGEPHYWRMVVPAAKSQPFAIAFQSGLSAMERRKVSKLYIDKVIPHRDGSPAVAPSLYGFTDGARYIFFSSDPARNRDDRFDLSEETWEFAGVREKVERLRIGNLKFQERLGRKRPRVEFLFEATALSADSRFKSYVHAMRQKLMGVVVADQKALGAVVYHLLETPEARESGGLRFVDKNQQLKVGLDDLHLELGMRLGDAVAAAVDTLLLRYIVVRFLEAYHPDAMEGLLDSGKILKKGKWGRKVGTAPGAKQAEKTLFGGDGGVSVAEFSATELEVAEIVSRPIGVDVSKAKRKAKGSDAMLFDLYGCEDEEAGVAAVLEEEDKRKTKFGGDFYLADLGKAAQAIQKELLRDPGSRGSKLIQDFLGRTGDPDRARWEFRYEDLRPKTLQDYYESSLGTAVQLTYDKKSDGFRADVGESKRQRKELGAYYTEERLCRSMVERSVKPLFEARLEVLRGSIAGKNAAEAQRAFDAIANFSVCDPTMGSAPFLRSAFDYLSEQYLRLCRIVGEAKSALPAFYDEVTKGMPFLREEKCRMDEEGVGRWEWHILRRMLYGVDIDLKAVNIACQTFTLSALKYLKQGERFPSFFNVNLKLGNALISPTRPADRPELSRKYGKEIAEIIKLRDEAKSLPNTEQAYEKLATLVRKVDQIRAPIVRELVEERVALVLEKYTDELRPFSWELEFPEVFFNPDGTVKAAAGFDVVIGNPPWEAIKFNNNEFLRSINAGDDVSVEDLCAENEAVAKAYGHYREVIERWKRWVSDGGQYEHQQGGRDRNKWRLATEVSWKLTQPQGAMSLVVPGGIIADEGGYALKRWIFPEGEAGLFISFEKENDVFTGSQAFTVMEFRKGRPTRKLGHLEGLTAAEQLLNLPYVPAFLSIETVEKMSPAALAIPSVRDEIDKSLLEKLYTHPLIVNAGAGWFAEFVSYDYHMTNDRRFFERGGTIPLVEGKNIKPYQVAAESQIEKRGTTRRQTEPGGQYRIACADVAGTLDPRRMFSSLIPHDYATGNTLNCFLVEGDDTERLFLISVLNSFVVEWRMRQIARSNHINKFMLAQLSVPRPPRADVERVAALVAALVTADARFDDLKPLLNGAKPATAEPARHDLKCRIDAEVAHLFGLTAEELDRVLSVFDKVPAATKDLVRAHFKTLSAGKP